jgi:hypothetical protein
MITRDKKKGGDRTNRLYYSRDRIEELVQIYKENGNLLFSPITNKVHGTQLSWRCSLLYNMDKPSVNYFFYLLEEPHFSIYSKERLDERSFSYSETYRGWTGWKKYTPEEIKKRVWMRMFNRSVSEDRRSVISNTLKEYNKTPEGISQRIKKSTRMRKYYATEAGREEKRKLGQKQSMTMKRLIASGVYTPTITNTWTHWNAKIIVNGTVKRFRSSWEACFWFCNQHCEYETIRVTCQDKIFVSDFFDRNTNTLYEIKPRNRYNIEIKKMTALQNYCKQNNLKFIWINENNIKSYINESLFIGENTLQLKQLKKAWKNLK